MDRPDLELLKGAIDMHAHTAPALFRRHIDDAALAEIALQFGMRGFVLKDHDASTTGRAYYVNRMYPQVESFGAVVLHSGCDSENTSRIPKVRSRTWKEGFGSISAGRCRVASCRGTLPPHGLRTCGCYHAHAVSRDAIS